MGFSKQCSQCGKIKFWYEFYKDRSCMFSVKTHCRACESKNKKKYREDNPEKVKELDRKYREAHPERIKEKQRKYREAHLDYNKEAKRKFKEANPDYDYKNWFKNKLKNDPDYWKKQHKKFKYERYMYRNFGLKFAESRQMVNMPLVEVLKMTKKIHNQDR
jgi:hypothetical protein